MMTANSVDHERSQGRGSAAAAFSRASEILSTTCSATCRSRGLMDESAFTFPRSGQNKVSAHVPLSHSGNVQKLCSDPHRRNHCVTRKNWFPGPVTMICPFVADGTSVHGPVRLVAVVRQPVSGVP